jgi:hypothetical protein
MSVSPAPARTSPGLVLRLAKGFCSAGSSPIDSTFASMGRRDATGAARRSLPVDALMPAVCVGPSQARR